MINIYLAILATTPTPLSVDYDIRKFINALFPISINYLGLVFG